MSECGREALLNVRQWSRGPPGCPIGRVDLPDVRVWSVDPPKCPETLPVVREWSRGPPGGPGVFARASPMSGCGREAFPDIRRLFQMSRSGR